MSLKEIALPDYKLRHELWNSISHGLGALFGIFVMIFCLIKVVNNGFDMNAIPSDPHSYTNYICKIISVILYSLGLIITYTISCIYHALGKHNGKRVLRVIDHDTVYLLIAGTYTPILLLVVPFPHSVALLAMTWYLSIMGIVFSCITLKFKYLNTGLYLVMGWLSLFLMFKMWAYNPISVYYLLAGGVVYSFGCIFYLLKKVPFMHSIWHLFVLGGAICHYFAVMALLK